MTFRSIARGAAVVSSVALFSGYVWYRSGAGVQRAERPEAPPPARAAEAQAMPVNNVEPGASLFEQNAGPGDLTLVDAAFASAEGDPGTAQPKAGYVFSVMTGQGACGPGGSKQYSVNSELMSSSKSGKLSSSPPPAQTAQAAAAPPKQKRTTLFSGSKSERVVLTDPSSAGEAVPAAPAPEQKPAPPSEQKPPEPERRVLMPSSKLLILPGAAWEGDGTFFEPSAGPEGKQQPAPPAPPAPAEPAPEKKPRKRRVLISGSKAPFSLLRVKEAEDETYETDETDAPPPAPEKKLVPPPAPKPEKKPAIPATKTSGEGGDQSALTPPPPRVRIVQARTPRAPVSERLRRWRRFNPPPTVLMAGSKSGFVSGAEVLKEMTSIASLIFGSEDYPYTLRYEEEEEPAPIEVPPPDEERADLRRIFEESRP